MTTQYAAVLIAAIYLLVASAAAYIGYHFGKWTARHYLSTYCFHGLHDQCRLKCKTCEAPCRCKCHKGGGNG